VPPPGPPSFDKNPYQPDNPYAAPTQAAMPTAGQQPPPPAYPGPPTAGYGYPGGPAPVQQPPAYPGAPAAGYGYPGAPGVPGIPQYPGQPGQLGQPGMPQYPGQPGYWQPPGQRGTNGMSIAAIVLGLLPCVPLLGAIFGFIGLSQTRKRGERGKGMAVTGIVGSFVWIAILAVLITIGVLNTGNTQITDLKAGQCFNTVDEKLSDFGKENDNNRTGSVDVVDCVKEHDAEAFAVYEIQSGDDDPYPGVPKVTADAQTSCVKYLRTYLDGAEPPSTVKLYFYLPPYDDWKAHHRTVICFLGSPDSRLTGSVKSGDGSSDGGSGSGEDTGDDGVGV
jgi:hypothetical protein